MRLFPDWSPLEVGEIDDFAFNVTTDVGTATVVSTAWTAGLTPGRPGTDPNPNSRVVQLSNPTSISVKLANNTIQVLYGNFVVGRVGPLPATAVGAIYIIDAQATLTDGRIIAYNNVVECVPPGDP
jgi:hypothetical protein